MKRAALFSLAGLAALLLVGSDMAMAQADLHEPSQAISGLLDLIQNSSNQWNSRLQGFARQLFWSLVVIDFVLILGPLVLRNADFGELMEALVKFILIVGFFASLLIFSVQWSEAIVNSFRQAGASAAGVGFQLAPGDMFGLGVNLAYTVSDVNTMNPGVAVAVALSAAIILLCYTFIAAFMMLTLVEAYIVINASVLFMGLGGSKFTREYAVSILRYALSVGAKLFVLTLIVGLILESSRQWQGAYQHDNTSMLTMVGLALICAVLSKTIPDLIQSLINGVSSGGGGVIGGMAAAGAAFGAGALAGLHASAQGGVLGSAGKSVSDLLKSYGSGSSVGAGGASMNSMQGAPGGGGGSGGSSSPRPGGSRVGGGGTYSAPPPGPAPSASSGAGSSSAQSQSSGSSSGSTSGAATGAVSGGNSQKAVNPASMAHAAAEMGMKTLGTGMSMAIPGAEGSEALSVGPPPTPPDLGDSGDPLVTPENIIRPAGVDAAVEPMAAAPSAIDTMSGLQEALNNRGKLS